MTTLREAATKALEALEEIKDQAFNPAKVFAYQPAIIALRAALAQQDEQSSNPVSSNPLLSGEPMCPRPGNRRPDNFTMAECILAGECGCTVAGHAYASTQSGTQSAQDRYANKLLAGVDDTPIVPFGGLSTHREWQELTEDEVMNTWFKTLHAKSHETYLPIVDFGRAIEAKLKEKNS